MASIRTLEKAQAGEGSKTWTVVGVLAAIALIVVLVSGSDGGGGGSGY